MLWLSTILLLLLSLLLFRHILRLSRLLHELEDSVCSQRRLIPEESRDFTKNRNILGLVDSINELIDFNNQTIIQKNDYLEQIDVISRRCQEAVIVFNEDHVRRICQSFRRKTIS